jgi:CAAX protease family protein
MATRRSRSGQAVSLYLLVTWLAAGGLIALQPITHIPTVVVDIVQFAPTTAVLVLMATRRVAAPRIWQGPTSATLRRIAVVFVIMAAIFGLTLAGLAAAGRPVQLTSLRSLGEPFWLIVVIQLVGACGEEFG